MRPAALLAAPARVFNRVLSELALLESVDAPRAARDVAGTARDAVARVAVFVIAPFKLHVMRAFPPTSLPIESCTGRSGASLASSLFARASCSCRMRGPPGSIALALHGASCRFSAILAGLPLPYVWRFGFPLRKEWLHVVVVVVPSFAVLISLEGARHVFVFVSAATSASALLIAPLAVSAKARLSDDQRHQCHRFPVAGSGPRSVHCVVARRKSHGNLQCASGAAACQFMSRGLPRQQSWQSALRSTYATPAPFFLF